MQRTFHRASLTRRTLTVLLCLYLVHAAPEPVNTSEALHSSLSPQAAVDAVVPSDSIISPAPEAQNASEVLRSSGALQTSVEALDSNPVSESSAAVPAWVPSQQEHCPADQAEQDADTAQPDTGSPQNASEPAAISMESAEDATGTSQPESLSDCQKQHQPGQQLPPRPSQQQRQTEEEQLLLQQLHQRQSQQQRQEEEEETDSTEEDRHNFALSKDGAKIVACNREAKKCSAILDTDSDTFMKNDCKADKWFIVELSQVAKVDAFQLSQYELYSSRVKEFEVRGRQSHPRGQGSDYSKALNTSGWQLLGKYSAAKVRGTQAFTVAQPLWLKYLQFHFISQYGTEPMCALNDILVYGRSAAEDLEDQLSATSLPEDDVQADIQPESVTEQSEVQQQTRPNAAGALIVSQDTGTDSQTDGQFHAAKADSSAEGIVDASNASGSASAHGESAEPTPVSNLTEASGALSLTSDQASLHSAPNTTHNISNPDSAVATAAAKVSDNAHSEASHDEMLLLPNSVSSNKARHGGSIYDMLVQEIKSLKLQQKLAPRQLADVQRNMSSYINKTTAEISALQQSVQSLQSEIKALQQGNNCSEDLEVSESALAKFADVDVDLKALVRQLQSVRTALHIVQHRVTAIVLMAIVAWLAVMVLTAPDLGRMTWILYVPIVMICAIGVLWLAGVLRILPNHYSVL